MPKQTKSEPTTISADGTKNDIFLKNLLARYPQYFDNILKSPDLSGVQIIYTQIDRAPNYSPVFTDYYFNVNPNRYFYPASTVKMPIAFLALEKLNNLKIGGLDRKTTMITETGFDGQTSVYNDPTSEDGRPAIENYIKKIFLTSDNDAYNRLYEFLGQEYINENLHKKGYKHTQLVHRLQIPLTEEQNRHTNPIKFFDSDGKLIYEKPAMHNQQLYPPRHIKLGKGYMENGKLINEPFDFSKKNRFDLEDLHNILRSVIFPQAIKARQRFNLTEDDYKFLMKCLSQFPSESVFPQYPDLAEWDAYCKFILYGNEKGKLPKHIRIFNKVGDAYGFLSDIAYVADFENNIEFMLSAVIYCNSDGIFNDDVYDYDSIGFPFMKNLGKVIYEYELKRVRKSLPDLSNLRFDYDK
ncbi:MAG TPA: serine hydrolase [Chitinophagaceae bacterium]|nr:serine hydrolase [Chitinophagaceae bacterium]